MITENAEFNTEKEQAILFADLESYSNLSESNLDIFHRSVLPTFFDGLQSNLRETIEYANTWGDGIIVISGKPGTLAMLALRIRNYFNHNESPHQKHFEHGMKFRIALHLHTVRYARDPLDNESKVPFGKNVIMAARLEPKTESGCVFVTKTMYNWLVLENNSSKQFSFKSKGEMTLAKDWGSTDVWELGNPREFPRGAQEPELNESQEGEEPQNVAFKRTSEVFTEFQHPTDLILGSCCQDHKEPKNEVCSLALHLWSNVSSLARNTRECFEIEQIVRILEGLKGCFSNLIAPNGPLDPNNSTELTMNSIAGIWRQASRLKRNKYDDEEWSDEERFAAFLRHRASSGGFTEADVTRLLQGIEVAKSIDCSQNKLGFNRGSLKTNPYVSKFQEHGPQTILNESIVRIIGGLEAIRFERLQKPDRRTSIESVHNIESRAKGMEIYGELINRDAPSIFRNSEAS